MAENVFNLGKETDTQIQKAQRVANKMNTKQLTLRYIVIKMSKVKDKEQQEKNNLLWTRELSAYDYQQIFQQEICRPERSGTIWSKC